MPALGRALAVLGDTVAAGRRPELIAVDDGSDDATREAVATMAATLPFPTTLLAHDRNRGIGAAVRSAATATSAPIVVTYDADLAYPLADLDRLLEALDAGADVATASPWHPDGTSERVGIVRGLPSRAASVLYRTRFGRLGLHTWTCGFRAWRRETFLACLPREDGFASTAEALVRAVRLGARVAEVPSKLSMRVDGVSKMRLAPTTRRHLGLLLRGPGRSPGPSTVIADRRVWEATSRGSGGMTQSEGDTEPQSGEGME